MSGYRPIPPAPTGYPEERKPEGHSWLRWFSVIRDEVLMLSRFGQFLSTVSQTAAAATPTQIRLDTTVFANTIDRDGPSQYAIVLPAAGFYNFSVSIQCSNSSSQFDNITVWLRQNGVDLANSASIAAVPPSHGGVNGACLITFNVYVAGQKGDNISLWWTTDAGASYLADYPASAVAPVHPASPSVILTVQGIG